MSDTELVNYFKTNHGVQCGRFSQDQVDRDILIRRSPLPWLKYFFRIALPAFLLSIKSTVHAQKFSATTEISSIKPNNKVAPIPLQIDSLKGRITDSAGIAIPGASIVIKGSAHGAVSDTAGFFMLQNVDPSATLNVSSIGYTTTEIKVKDVKDTQNLKLTLVEGLLGEVVVTGGFIAKRTEKTSLKRAILSEKKSSSITAFPNPVLPRSTINIRCNKIEHGIYSAEIYSIAGQVIQSTTCTYDKRDKQIALRIGDLMTGTYFVRLTHRNTRKAYTEQFVVSNTD